MRMMTFENKGQTAKTPIQICDTDSDEEIIMHIGDDNDDSSGGGRALIVSNQDCVAQVKTLIEPPPVDDLEKEDEWNDTRVTIDTHNDTSTLFASVPVEYFPEYSRLLASSQQKFGRTKWDSMREQASVGLYPFLLRPPIYLRDTIHQKDHLLFQKHVFHAGYCFHKSDDKTAKTAPAQLCPPNEELTDSENPLLSNLPLSDPTSLRDLATLFVTTKQQTGGIAMDCLKGVATGQLKMYLEHNNLQNGWLAVKRSKLDLFQSLLAEVGYSDDTESFATSQLHVNNNIKKFNDNDKKQSLNRIMHAIQVAYVSLTGTQIELACLSTMSRLFKGTMR